ncbi:MAG: phosphate acyltransferase [Sphaerochaeta sp.]
MEYRSFEELIQKTKDCRSSCRLVLAAAADKHSLEAVFRAQDQGLVSPVLVGDKVQIDAILAELRREVPSEDVYDVPDLAESCKKAVSLIKEAKADFLMKGKVDTKIFLKAVVDKENGLSEGDVMSHFSIFEVPGYHKLLVPVDGGMVPYPTLEQKKAIIENTVGVLHRFGYECPKVGVVTCVEKVNPKMPETVEAAALAEMNRNSEIFGCLVDGPISFDCAVNKEIAACKGYTSEIAGDVDVLLAPNIHVGNIMGKMLTCFAGAKMAGFVAGASCPIIMTSRGSGADEKYYSIALAAAASEDNR